MKKLLLSFAVVAVFGLSNFASAQKYFTYDGDTFNVLFTCDDANTKVTDVEFSFNDAWVKFALVGKTDLEGTKEGGFIFFCKDGKGDYYAIDYYRDGDYVIVHACDADLNYTGTDWTLKRRAGE
jgi:hypothetical protein